MTSMSRLWEQLTSEEFANLDESFLTNFRAPSSANKFVAWDPYEKSTRYMKFLLLVVIQQQSDEFFKIYRNIGNCIFGNPLSVDYEGCKINADYLSSVEEFMFLNSSYGLDDVTSIVEIGAGFGRTCHTILKSCPEVEVYTIIDLDPMLKLSKGYLSLIAPELIERVQFVSAQDTNSQLKIMADLAINIDSFQEMPKTIIDGYMDRVITNVKKFYCKNPIGKYSPACIGMPDLTSEQLLDVFTLGYCQDVIDIFNIQDLKKARVSYMESYRPDKGDTIYNIVADKPMELFPYYHHVLYERQE